MNRDEVYDWRAVDVDEVTSSAAARVVSGEVIKRPADAVNPVNGHGRGCACAQCPGWYDRRADLAVGLTTVGGTTPPPRRPNPLLDQVIPVCCLLATITVCGLVLLPVIVPVLTLSVILIIALAVTVCIGAVAVILVTQTVRREVLRDSRPQRWRR